MPPRSPGRRAVSRFAVLVLMPMLAGFSGCRWLPKRHPVPSIDPRTLSRPGAEVSDLVPLEGASGSTDLAKVPLPPLPLRPVSDAEALAATPGEPTPQLDEALRKARALDESFVSGLEEKTPLPPPRSLPALPPSSRLQEPRPESVPTLAPTPPSKAESRVDESVSPASLTVPEPSEVPVDVDTAWGETFDRLLDLARKQAEMESSPGPWTARRTLLERLAEPESSHGAGEDEPLLWETVLTVLAEADARASEEPKEPAEAPSLAVADLRLCRQVAGFGQYEPAEADDLRPGRELMLYWEIEGFQTVEEDGFFRTRLATNLEILAETGESPLWSRAFNDTEDVCRRPRRDYFVNYRLTIPESLKPGSYRLRLTLQDRQTRQTAQRDLPFAVAP